MKTPEEWAREWYPIHRLHRAEDHRALADLIRRAVDEAVAEEVARAQEAIAGRDAQLLETMMQKDAERGRAVAEERAAWVDEVARLGQEILSTRPGPAHEGGALALAMLKDRVLAKREARETKETK